MAVRITLDDEGEIAIDDGEVIGQRWMGGGGAIDWGTIDGLWRRWQWVLAGRHQYGRWQCCGLIAMGNGGGGEMNGGMVAKSPCVVLP